MSDEKKDFPGADSFLLPGGREYLAGSRFGEKEVARHRKQRAARGWSDFDWWSGDTYLAHVIGSMALEYRDGCCSPSGMTEKQWQKILTRIGEPLLAYAREKFTASTLEEETVLHANAKKALRLFAKHFDHFWD